ncbi:MAG: hypothetical protein WCJ18_06080, partial [Planctomycetota bacterium]
LGPAQFSPLTTYGAADPRRSKMQTLVELPPTASAASGFTQIDGILPESRTGFSLSWPPDHPIRLVEVRTPPGTTHSKYRGGSTGPGSDGVLRRKPTLRNRLQILGTGLLLHLRARQRG